MIFGLAVVANLAALLCEVAGLVAFTVWGAGAPVPVAGRWALAVTVPLGAAVLWGRYCAPRAAVKIPRPAVAAIKLALLAAAALALTSAGQPVWAVTLAGTALGGALLGRALPDPRGGLRAASSPAGPVTAR